MVVLTILFAIIWKTQGQGPNAPEAASFEPVDATDMVNLLTGDFTYVQPLINVPSPEGGYPLALSYHAGIAVGQEASWVGLGWSLNPGAINRSVNGNPDDWAKALIREFAYDEGGHEYSTSVSIGYGIPNVLSVGVGVSWGSNRSLAGSVSMSFKGTYGRIGTNGVSFGFGVNDNLGIGASFGNNGSFGVSANIGVGNASISFGVGSGSSGFNGNLGLGASGRGGKNLSASSLGVDFSSNGIGYSGKINGMGTSGSFDFKSEVNASDYDVTNKSSQFSLITPFGYFSYGKQEVSWKLDKVRSEVVQGSMYLYLNEFTSYFDGNYTVRHDFTNSYDVNEINTESKFEQSTKEFYTKSNNALFANFDNYNVSAQGISGSIQPQIDNNLNLKITKAKHFGARSRGDFLSVSYVENSPNHSILKPVTFDFGEYTNTYLETLPYDMSYPGTPWGVGFSTPTLTSIPEGFTLSSDSKRLYLNNSFSETKHKLRKGKYVEYFTIEEINSGVANSKGYLSEANNYDLSPQGCGFVNEFTGDYLRNFNKSIGGFKITMKDGKTYHYSLPVYQMEKVRRIYGIVEGKNENQAHMDRVQANPYATHWLLTAITGPDYVKNDVNRKYPDEGDYGYWVRFDYGKWSEGYIWKTPNGNKYSENADIFGKKKEYSWGRKQLYYLDKIKTRTHSALFIKKLRQDQKSEQMVYKNMAVHKLTTLQNKYVNVKWQPTLGLSDVYLFKNEDANLISKASGEGLEVSTEVSRYTLNGFKNNDGVWKEDVYSEIQFSSNLHDEVYDISDISEAHKEKVVKSVYFGHDYNPHRRTPIEGHPIGAYTNTPPSGRHSLNSLSFGGKRGRVILPATRYSYNQSIENPGELNIGDFGYHKYEPAQGSLKKISLPTGGSINVAYQPDRYDRIAIKNGRVFTSKLKFSFLTNPTFNPATCSTDTNPESMGSTPKSTIRIKIEVDEQDVSTKSNLDNIKFKDYFDFSKPFFMDMWYCNLWKYNATLLRGTINIDKEQAQIIELNETGNYMIVEVQVSSPALIRRLPQDAEPVSVLHAMNDWSNTENRNLPRFNVLEHNEGDSDHQYSLRHTIIGNKIPTGQARDRSSGIRVQNITVNDGVGGSYTTLYNYGTSGVLPYYPEPNYQVQQQAPYISLLPGPIVTYGKVTEVKFPYTDYQISNEYKFKVLDDIDESVEGRISFGDILKMESSEESFSGNLNVSLKNTIIYNEISSLGRLEEKKIFNSKGHMVEGTQYAYSNFEERYSIGQHKQAYHTIKSVNDYYYNTSNVYGTVSEKVDRFGVLKSIKSIGNNFTTTKYFDKYDLLTGEVLESRVYSGNGKAYKTVTIPAYKKYSEMGAKVDNINNKNMLTQAVGEYSYVFDNDEWKEIGVGITTWKNDWNYQFNNGTSVSSDDVWRKHKTFTWNGGVAQNGIYTGFTDFNFSQGASNTNWKKTSEITRYNQFSVPTEIKDINENFSSTKMGDSYSKIIATANANYNEMYYSSAEYVDGSYFDGGIKSFGRKQVPDAHTGKSIVEVEPGQNAFEVTIPKRESRKSIENRFKVSVWVKRTHYWNARIKLNNEIVDHDAYERVNAGKWVLLNGYVNLSNSSDNTIAIVSINGSIQLDDFRVHPAVSGMKTYGYDEYDQLSIITGENGLSTKYVYDEAGRLIETWEEVQDVPYFDGGFKQIVKNNYKFNTK